MNKRRHVIIAGRVQGVGFRANTKKTAALLGLTGWVKNMPNGEVEAVFEGDEPSVKAMLDWCHQGPSLARVSHVESHEEPFSGAYATFDILY